MKNKGGLAFLFWNLLSSLLAPDFHVIRKQQNALYQEENANDYAD
jgi:hypothetical protein